MNSLRTRRRYWALAAAGMALSAAALGEDAPKTSALQTAKEGYSELKAATTQTNSWQQLTAPSPQTLGPVVELAPVLPPAPISTPPTADQRASVPVNPNKNWLVEAMTKPSGQERGTLEQTDREPSRPDRLRREDGNIQLGPNQNRREHTANGTITSAGASGLSAVPSKDAAVANNPLERYLTAWMTSRDLAILRPDKAVDSTSARDLDRQLAGEIALGYDRPGLVPNSDGGGVSTAVVAKNPYLELFADPPARPARTDSSSAANEFPRSISPPAATLAPAQAAPASPAPINSAAAEHERAREEAKYFKQLKRF